MMKILDVVLWLPRRILLAHYVLWVNLAHTRSDANLIETKCARAEDFLLGQARRQ